MKGVILIEHNPDTIGKECENLRLDRSELGVTQLR